MATIPAVQSAEYVGGYKVRLTFHDGVEAVVDFEEWLEGPIFEPLLEEDFFQRFFIEAGTLVWPNGADIAPETLYAAAKSRAAV